jgi:hypothetical protein
MSTFVVPHGSRPWWQKTLVWLRNIALWLVPATDETFDSALPVSVRLAAALLVATGVGFQVVLWTMWIFGPDPMPLWLVLSASGAGHLIVGALYHTVVLTAGPDTYARELPPEIQIGTILKNLEAERRAYERN